MRSFALLPLVVWLALALGPADAAGAAHAATNATPPITAQEARQVLDVLNDPAKRAAVVNTLQAVVKAESTRPAAAAAPASPSPPARAPAAAAATSKVTLQPGSLGAAVVLGANGLAGRLLGSAIGAVKAVQGFPLLWRWIVATATDPEAETLLRQAIWRVAIAVAGGLAVQWGVRWLLRRPVEALEGRSLGTDPASAPVETAEARAEIGETEPPNHRRIAAHILLRRLPLVLLRFALDLLPLLGFAIAGHSLAATVAGGSEQTRLIVVAMIDAYLLCAAIMCLARLMLSPHRQRLRLVPISDATAQWARNWILRIVAVGVFGYAIAQVGGLLGMSAPTYDGLLKLVSLINHVFLAIMVLQKRRAVQRWIRAPAGAGGTTARLRNSIAAVWHWVALFFLAASWIVWAVEVRNGVAQVIHYFIALVLVAIGARLVLIVLLGSLDRLMHLAPESAERHPGLDQRLHAYHPRLAAIARVLVYLLGALALLELWGLPTFEWFSASFLGQRLVAAFGTMALTLVLALFVWEAANAAIEAHIARLARNQQIARSARVLTLLPLLRTALLVSIVVIAGLTVLSEIGINIAPLLAGAGIIGVAIGFGSQKLVQDLITGIFLLLENAVQVGDWVTVSGLSGKVEHLSVRTIRLRAADGSVHIIPFSAVSSVTNTNRGLGNAAVSVTVSYAEDTDRVGQVLQEIAAEMRKEPDFAGAMLSELQLWGVDRLDGASATIAGQIVCTDAGRWPVQREFNRRVKMRFQQIGVTLFNPQQSVMISPAQPAPSRAARVGSNKAAAE